jgi:hypothetical protein
MVFALEIDLVGALNDNAFALEDMDEPVEFPFGEPNHPFWIAKAGRQPTRLLGERRQIARDHNVAWWDYSSFNSSNDNLFERVPLRVGVDRARRFSLCRGRPRPFGRSVESRQGARQNSGLPSH